MKRLFLLLALISLPYAIDAQNKYIYNIISFTGNVKKEGVKVSVDNGITVDKLKDEEGNTIKFNTIATALMYFTSRGWELYISGSSVSGSGVSINGSGSSATQTTSYWIIRKQCTEEELNAVLKEGIRK